MGIPGLEPVRNERIWLPDGSTRDVRETAAARAVAQYGQDFGTDLILGQNRENNEWVVFIKHGPQGQPFPVLGLGFELPTPEDIKKRLYHADTARRGGKIALETDKHNEAVKKSYRNKASDGAGAAAEAFDWAHRKMGTHPNPRIFVPDRKDT